MLGTTDRFVSTRLKALTAGDGKAKEVSAPPTRKSDSTNPENNYSVNHSPTARASNCLKTLNLASAL